MKQETLSALIKVFAAQQNTDSKSLKAVIELTKMLPAGSDREEVVVALESVVNSLSEQGQRLEALVQCLHGEMEDSDGA